MAQKHWGEADAAGPRPYVDCHLEMGGDGLMEGGIFQVCSVAFQESSGRFLVKGEQNGRWLMLAHFPIRGISGGIQSTRDHLELQEHDLFLAGRRDNLAEDYDEPVAVSYACNYSTEKESHIEDLPELHSEFRAGHG